MDLNSQVVDVRIEFTDGLLTCKGTYQSSEDSEFLSATDEQILMHMSVFTLHIVGEGELELPDGSTQPLEPGTYVVVDGGLFKRVAPYSS